MSRGLSEFVGFPAVIGLILGGIAMLVWAATIGGPLGQIVGLAIAVVVAIAGLALTLVIWIKRVNAEIGRNRQEIERDLDAILDDRDAED